MEVAIVQCQATQLPQGRLEWNTSHTQLWLQQMLLPTEHLTGKTPSTHTKYNYILQYQGNIFTIILQEISYHFLTVITSKVKNRKKVIKSVKIKRIYYKINLALGY